MRSRVKILSLFFFGPPFRRLDEHLDANNNDEKAREIKNSSKRASLWKGPQESMTATVKKNTPSDPFWQELVIGKRN
ncbi:hypothetical protein CEXT_260541 [Caerostris extrusa]|uniref:Uncharacterized protein n=1 Tax=Caerostris extrusa TaxID=172846 RepID=A0AAV4UFE5_CAEEX|nr:hypothetical protein CEXT_260541 [Caerostris extrusa]